MGAASAEEKRKGKKMRLVSFDCEQQRSVGTCRALLFLFFRLSFIKDSVVLFLHVADALISALGAVGDSSLLVDETLPCFALPPSGLLIGRARAEKHEGEEFGEELHGTNRDDDGADGLHVVVEPLEDALLEFAEGLVAVARDIIGKHLAKVGVVKAVARWKRRLGARAALYVRAVDKVGYGLAGSVGIHAGKVHVDVTRVSEDRDGAASDKNDDSEEHDRVQREHALVVVLGGGATPRADAKCRGTGDEDRPKGLFRVHRVNGGVRCEEIRRVSHGNDTREGEDRVQKNEVALRKGSADHFFFSFFFDLYLISLKKRCSFSTRFFVRYATNKTKKARHVFS